MFFMQFSIVFKKKTHCLQEGNNQLNQQMWIYVYENNENLMQQTNVNSKVLQISTERNIKNFTCWKIFVQREKEVRTRGTKI